MRGKKEKSSAIEFKLIDSSGMSEYIIIFGTLLRMSEEQLILKYSK